MFNKLLVIYITGLPGFQKLLAFILLERLISEIQLGYFSSDYSVAQIITLFTSVGLCAVILSRVPKLDVNSGESYLFSSLKCSLIYSTLASLLICLLNYLDIVNNYLELILFIFSWSINQILRHYALARKRYAKIAIIDTLAIMIFVTLIFNSYNPFMSLTISYLAGCIFYGYKQIKKNTNLLDYSDQKKSIEFGANNLIISLGTTGLPILLSRTDGVESSALVGYILSMTIAMQLLTRALGLFYIPDMAAAKEKKIQDEILTRFKKNNIALSSIMILIMLSAYIIIIKLSLVDIFNKQSSFQIYILLLLNSFSVSLIVPLQSYLMAIEKSKILLENSVFYFLLIVAGYIIYYLYSENFTVVDLLIYLILARIVSYASLNQKTNKIRYMAGNQSE